MSSTASIPQVSLLTAGRDKPYALGLVEALVNAGWTIDFLGSDFVSSDFLRQHPQIHFLNLRGDQREDSGRWEKICRVLKYYSRLIRYALTAQPKIFHILWNNKFETFDRTVLMLFYRLLGKQIVFTAHNVNAGARDSNDSWFNRATLRFQYRLCDQIFVHTAKMKIELCDGFGVTEQNVDVIPFGVNNTMPNTKLTGEEARQRLGLAAEQKVVVFFGMIAPYKGLEYLVEAMGMLVQKDLSYRLVIAGQPKNCAPYWDAIQKQIARFGLTNYVVQRIEFLPDAEIEVCLKAADVFVLPYTHIFQSGVLLLGYNFGLPVIATDVGSMKEDVIEGKTGFVCQSKDGADLARTIDKYFSSGLYHRLEENRKYIRDFAVDRYSWTKVGEITGDAYLKLMSEKSSNTNS